MYREEDRVASSSQVLQIRKYFIFTDLLSFEHPSVLLFCLYVVETTKQV